MLTVMNALSSPTTTVCWQYDAAECESNLDFDVLVDNAQQQPKLGVLQEGHEQLKGVGGQNDWIARCSSCLGRPVAAYVLWDCHRLQILDLLQHTICALECEPARQAGVRVKLGMAWQSRLGRDRAAQGRAGCVGRPGQGKAGQVRAGQDAAGKPPGRWLLQVLTKCFHVSDQLHTVLACPNPPQSARPCLLDASQSPN